MQPQSLFCPTCINLIFLLYHHVSCNVKNKISHHILQNRDKHNQWFPQPKLDSHATDVTRQRLAIVFVPSDSLTSHSACAPRQFSKIAQSFLLRICVYFSPEDST